MKILKKEKMNVSRLKRVVALGLCLGLACCELEENIREENEQIKIGLLMPFTGDGKEGGISIREACELVVWEINSQGGVMGKDLKLKIADTEGDTSKSAVAAAELLTQDIVAFVGALQSGNTIKIAEETAIPATIPLISPQSTSPYITTMEAQTGTDLVFRTIASDLITGEFTGKYLYEELGKQTVGIIYVDDPYGRGLANAFAESFQTAGGAVLSYLSYPALTPTEIESFDFRPKTDSLFIEEPEVIYMIARPLAGAKITIIAEDYLSNLYHPLFIGTDVLVATEFLQNASNTVTDSMYYYISAANPDSEDYKNYTEAFYNRYQKEPTQFSENGYDAVYLLAYAMLAAQSEEPVLIAAHLRAVAAEGDRVSVGENQFLIAKALLDADKDIDYEGASGSLEMDDYGDIVSTFINILVSVDREFEGTAIIPFTKSD